MDSAFQSVGISSDTADLIISYATRIIGVIVILIIAFMVAGMLRNMTQKWLTRIKFDATLSKFLANMVRWAILIFTFIGCLGVFGIQTTSFAAVIGGASLAVGMAFQGSLGNIAAGIMLLIFRPYSVGDYIKVGGAEGIVDSIELFVTTLDTPDNRRVIIPNGKVFGETIENVTHHDRRRVDLVVGVGYDADIDQTRQVLAEAAKVENVDEVQIYLLGLGESSVDWAIRCWTEKSNYWAVRETAMRSIKYALDNNHIDIPYPHRVLINYDGNAKE